MGLLAVWLALAAVLSALAMVLHRPLFTDGMVTAVLYACVLVYTLAGVLLWGTRHDRTTFAPARTQAKTAIAIALPATIIVYLLVAFAQQQSSS